MTLWLSHTDRHTGPGPAGPLPAGGRSATPNPGGAAAPAEAVHWPATGLKVPKTDLLPSPYAPEADARTEVPACPASHSHAGSLPGQCAGAWRCPQDRDRLGQYQASPQAEGVTRQVPGPGLAVGPWPLEATGDEGKPVGWGGVGAAPRWRATAQIPGPLMRHPHDYVWAGTAPLAPNRHPGS